jgi:hypothetical protein
MADEALLHDLRKLGLKKHKKYTKTNAKGMLVIPTTPVEPLVETKVEDVPTEQPTVEVIININEISVENKDENLKNAFVALPENTLENKSSEENSNLKPKKVWNFQKRKNK